MDVDSAHIRYCPAKPSAMISAMVTALVVLFLVASVSAQESPAPQSSAPACEMRVGTEAPYPPFQFYDSNGSLTGIEIDLLQAVGAEIGCTFIITPLPWARIVTSIAEGVLDVVMNAIRKPERDHFAWFSDPYLSIEVRLFVRREQAPYLHLEKIEDLLNVPGQIGTVNGYSYGIPFDQLLATHPEFAARIDAARDHQANLRKLMSGRLAGVIGQTVTVLATARDLGISDRIVGLTPAFDSPDYHFMLSRATVTKERFQRFNDAVVKLRANGKVAEFVARYQ
ncbi:polar amino acid transport system substrate-binding protein [uncultured Gammaproteobacteria bacterium]